MFEYPLRNVPLYDQGHISFLFLLLKWNTTLGKHSYEHLLGYVSGPDIEGIHEALDKKKTQISFIFVSIFDVQQPFSSSGISFFKFFSVCVQVKILKWLLSLQLLKRMLPAIWWELFS